MASEYYLKAMAELDKEKKEEKEKEKAELDKEKKEKKEIDRERRIRRESSLKKEREQLYIEQEIRRDLRINKVKNIKRIRGRTATGGKIVLPKMYIGNTNEIEYNLPHYDYAVFFITYPREYKGAERISFSISYEPNLRCSDIVNINGDIYATVDTVKEECDRIHNLLLDNRLIEEIEEKEAKEVCLCH